MLPRTVAVIMRCDTGAGAAAGAEPATPGLISLRPEPEARVRREDNGITRLNNVRIMGLKPRLSMGSLGSHNCQTTGISAFSNPRSLARPRPPSRWHLGILLDDKIEIGVDTPSS